MPGGMKRILNGPQLQRHHLGILTPTLLFLLQCADSLLQCRNLSLKLSLVVFHLSHNLISRQGRSPSPIPTRAIMTMTATMSSMSVTIASHRITSCRILYRSRYITFSQILQSKINHLANYQKEQASISRSSHHECENSAFLTSIRERKVIGAG